MRVRVYSQRITEWDVLVASLEARLPELEWMRPLYEELVELVAELRSIVVEQEAARAQFHDQVSRRMVVEREGVELRGRIAAHLKAHLGFRNDQLRQFGIDPLPRVVRRRSEPDEETPESVKPAEPDVEED